MLRKSLFLALVLATPAGAALAADKCSVPQAEWRTQADLEAHLAGMGWTISKIKQEDGCFEVYGKDDKGTRVEVFIDPKTFEVVGSDD